MTKNNMIMYCKKCGSELPDNARYCQQCGAQAESQDDSVTYYNTEDEPEDDSVSFASPIKIKIFYILACVGAVIALVSNLAYFWDLDFSTGPHYGPGRVKLFYSIIDFCTNVPEWIPEVICTVFFALLVWEFKQLQFQYQHSKGLKKTIQIMLITSVVAIIWNIATEVIDDFIIIGCGYCIIPAVWIGCGIELRKSEITPLGTWLLSWGIFSFATSVCFLIYGFIYYTGCSNSEQISMFAGVLVIISAVCECMVYISMGRYLIGLEADDDEE